jgi:hypothetical protein
MKTFNEFVGDKPILTITVATPTTKASAQTIAQYLLKQNHLKVTNTKVTHASDENELVVDVFGSWDVSPASDKNASPIQQMQSIKATIAAEVKKLFNGAAVSVSYAL